MISAIAYCLTTKTSSVEIFRYFACFSIRGRGMRLPFSIQHRQVHSVYFPALQNAGCWVYLQERSIFINGWYGITTPFGIRIARLHRTVNAWLWNALFGRDLHGKKKHIKTKRWAKIAVAMEIAKIQRVLFAAARYNLRSQGRSRNGPGTCGTRK